jgi:hypothetical protein
MLKNDIRFDGPGRYIVTTREEVSADIFELYTLKKAISEQTGGDNASSQLVIDIKDQSELLSFLNILYDNHHTIIKVELILSTSRQEDLSNSLINR